MAACCTAHSKATALITCGGGGCCGSSSKSSSSSSSSSCGTRLPSGAHLQCANPAGPSAMRHAHSSSSMSHTFEEQAARCQVDADYDMQIRPSSPASPPLHDPAHINTQEKT